MKSELTLIEGLKIQAEQLAVWKTKLVPELYEALVIYANTDKENWSDGFDVKRGNTLDNFIANWSKEQPFNFNTELVKLFAEFDGQEFDGMIFCGQNAKNGAVHLSYKANAVAVQNINIFCTPFWEVTKGLIFDVSNGGNDYQIVEPCPKPTNAKEFAEFRQFYTTQLCTIQGRFASVESVSVNTVDKTYTVEGFLIPKQVIKYDDFSDWNSLVGYSDNPIVDCQLDLDGGLNFQYVDYNIESNGDINLDDTPKFGGGFITRDYRSCEKIELIDELHPLTARILDQFHIHYSSFGSDGDDETRIMLDGMVRDTLKNS